MAKKHIIGLKELRLHFSDYIDAIQKGNSFIVLRRSKPVFKIVPVDDEWEEVIDFTKIQKGGIHIDDILSRL